MISTIFLLNEESNSYCLILLLVMNEWKKKPLLDLTFWHYLGQGNFISSVKSQGILERDVYGYHLIFNNTRQH